MAAVILAIVGAFFCGAGLWLAFGPRLSFSGLSDRAGEWLNLLCYVLGCLPIVFVLVFFGIELI